MGWYGLSNSQLDLENSSRHGQRVIELTRYDLPLDIQLLKLKELSFVIIVPD